MRSVLLTALAAALAIPLHGEPNAVLRVDFSNPGLYPSNWTLEIHPDGTGHFHAEGGTRPADEAELMLPGKVDRDVILSEGFTKGVFDTVRHNKLLNEDCDSHMKVAFQGTKKIIYDGPDGHGGCEFNYSRNKDIQQLGESLVGVGSTLLEGARLELLLQHDPLGLDRATEFIMEASGDGRLQQICAIRGILERLESDPRVLDRVRKRARILLAKGEN
jgi:hypothetical protein